MPAQSTISSKTFNHSRWKEKGKWCWSDWMVASRRRRIDLSSALCTKFNYKWIKDLNTRTDTLNLIEEKVDLWEENSFIQAKTFWTEHRYYSTMININNWDLVKLKSMCKAKDTIIWTKWLQNGKRFYWLLIWYDRGLIFKMYKELKKLDIKETTQLKILYGSKHRSQKKKLQCVWSI